MLYSREVKDQGMHHERQSQVWRAEALPPSKVEVGTGTVQAILEKN